jgi:hypothetical protein
MDLPPITKRYPSRWNRCAAKRIAVMLNRVERSYSREIVLPPQHEG